MRAMNRTADCIFLGIAAALVFVAQSLAWPLSPGRDFGTYVQYFVDMWHAEPAYPMLMLYRPPVAPLFIGVCLKMGGPLLLEIAQGALFCVSILAVYRIGLH